jgi:phosphatidylserine decarboxylase
MSIIYIDRKGHKRQGETGQDRLLAFIYGHAVTRCLIRPFLSPVVSRIGGAFLDTRISGLAVPGFVKKNGIDLSLYEKQIFDSYNDFFTRKIRAEERPVNPDANALVSPSDGKVSVYKIHENGHFLIKHTEYTLEQLLQDKKLAKRYLDGHIYVIRLTVDDYHRYCYAADGRKSEQRKIAGILHTVNPVANDVCPIYKMNSREYCLIKTERFGTLLQMEVGALMVGKISNNQQGLGFVHKGVEKGRFEFGGSTIILLTQKNVVIPDKDLLEHTGSGMETLVKMGEQIGRSANRLDA